MTKPILILLNILLFAVLGPMGTVSSTQAAEAEDIKGWELGSVYNAMYNPKERETLKGRVITFTSVVPLPEMAPGTAIVLEEGKNDKTLVHVCPQSYASAKEIGLKKGDSVKIKGSWIEIDGEFIFVAAKIKKGDNFSFKVRKSSDGTPFWTMSAEQLALEKADTE